MATVRSLDPRLGLVSFKLNACDVSMHPRRVAIQQAEPTTAVVVPWGLHEDLDAERVAAFAASLQLVPQRMPQTIRELVTAHHLPVDPKGYSLGKRGLVVPSGPRR